MSNSSFSKPARDRRFSSCTAASGFDERQPFVAPLSAKRRLIAPSHPGFGQSSLPDWLDSVDDIAHLYLELLDKLGLDKIDLVGCSIGGWIAAEMATKSPERIAGWSWSARSASRSGRPTSSTSPTSSRCRRPTCKSSLFHDPAKMAPDPGKMSDDELAIMFRNRETLALLVWEPWMHNPKLKQRLHRVRRRRCSSAATATVSFPPITCKAYAALLPNARTLTIPAAGHAPHLEQPEAFASAVLEFLGA